MSYDPLIFLWLQLSTKHHFELEFWLEFLRTFPALHFSGRNAWRILMKNINFFVRNADGTGILVELLKDSWWIPIRISIGKSAGIGYYFVINYLPPYF